MKNMTIGRYLPLNSPIHRIDPRAKIIGMIILMMGIFAGANFISFGIIGIFIIVLLKVSKLSVWKVIKGLKFMWMMFIFLTIMNIFFIKEGTLLWTTPIFDIQIYSESLYRTGFIIVRIALMISIATILTTTTKPLDMTQALEWLMSPLKLVKINVHIFAMMISIALRFIPTLIDEMDKVMMAQASRGLDMTNGTLRDKIRGLVALIIPLLVSSFHMAGDLANAMEVRGYNPSAKRTRFRILKAKFTDFLAVIMTAGVTTYVFLVKNGVFEIPYI